MAAAQSGSAPSARRFHEPLLSGPPAKDRRGCFSSPSLQAIFLRQPESQAAASMTKKCLLSTSKMAGFDKVRFFLSVIDNKLDFPPAPS
jgi:hypothetical protein